MDTVDIQSEQIDALEEQNRWKAKDVSYIGGAWPAVRKHIPEFELVDFKAGDGLPENPYSKVVMRKPLKTTENPIPVGVVSNSYTLAQHQEVGNICIKEIEDAGIDPKSLHCEVGLTELGEWMNLRIYFPKEFNLEPADGKSVGLRLECYNSVDGSSRLTILFGWIRFICANGIIIGETLAKVSDIHNSRMDLSSITEIINIGLEKVENDRRRIQYWEKKLIPNEQRWNDWINGILSSAWGKKAACRVFHICAHGHDVEISNPFSPDEATKNLTVKTNRVAGAPEKAINLYDVSQALSWIATNRSDAEQRLKWQSQISSLLDDLMEQKFKVM